MQYDIIGKNHTQNSSYNKFISTSDVKIILLNSNDTLSIQYKKWLCQYHKNIEKLNKEDLSKAINYLIETDFHALIQLLYKIDINEHKLKQALQNNAEKNAGDIIADMIIERQQQKEIFRKMFKQQNDIPDNEKW